MKLKPQPRAPKPRSMRGARTRPRTAASRGAGRQARRPGTPLRRRVGARLPSIRRLIAAVGAVATAAVLVALLNGPWMRVTEVGWAGERYTDADDLRDTLETQRGSSLLTVDTEALRDEIERLPAVDRASVTAGIGGRLEATVVEREVAFVWATPVWEFLGAADGTLFAREAVDRALDAATERLPRIDDKRSATSLLAVGDRIPEALLRTAVRVAALDPALLGSGESRLSVQIDDEFGIRLLASDEGWEVALGVYGIDPRETAAQADDRLDRQVAAVRTLFATHPVEEVGWVDVRNPGKVYFRAKG
jgi:cell division septal protein FtsQ